MLCVNRKSSRIASVIVSILLTLVYRSRVQGSPDLLACGSSWVGLFSSGCRISWGLSCTPLVLILTPQKCPVIVHLAPSDRLLSAAAISALS